MTEIKLIRDDEKATAILAAVRQIDDGAELVPVVHGRLINEREIAGGFAGECGADCSVCGVTIAEHMWKINFCPHCGAKLDGATED